MAKIRKRSVAPIYTVGVVWLAWALLLPLYRPLHYVAAAVVSLLVYALGRKVLWRDRVIVTADPEPQEPPKEEAPKAQPKQPEPPKDPEVAALLAERDKAVSEMRRLNDSIEDPVISAQIDHLEEVTGKIIDHVAHNPQKRPQSRRFLD